MIRKESYERIKCYLHDNVIIGALEQEHCKDYINKAEILEFLKGFEILHNHDELRSNLIHGIMNLSSPKMGYWIESDTNMYTCSYCSRCVSIVPEDNSIKLFKYCPYCSANMIEPQEGEVNADETDN